MLMRMHQWVKNVFVLAPLFFTPDAGAFSSVATVFAGFLCFCALSSAVYICNDYADREADRLHPEKRHRPLAAGSLSTAEAFSLASLLGALGLAGAYALSLPFFVIAVGYCALNLAYSFVLKHVSILDIIVITVGYILRIEAGSALIDVRPSVWMVICTGFLALFLALAKRRDDLVKTVETDHRRSLDGYNRQFVDSSLMVIVGALIVSYAIWTTDALAMERLGSESLYLTIPFVLAGVLRYLQIVMVEERSGSPTRIVLGDRFIILAVLGWLLTFGLLIYW